MTDTMFVTKEISQLTDFLSWQPYKVNDLCLRLQSFVDSIETICTINIISVKVFVLKNNIKNFPVPRYVKSLYISCCETTNMYLGTMEVTELFPSKQCCGNISKTFVMILFFCISISSKATSIFLNIFFVLALSR